MLRSIDVIELYDLNGNLPTASYRFVALISTPGMEKSLERGILFISFWVWIVAKVSFSTIEKKNLRAFFSSLHFAEPSASWRKPGLYLALGIR
jgi:hypothetical protein